MPEQPQLSILWPFRKAVFLERPYWWPQVLFHTFHGTAEPSKENCYQWAWLLGFWTFPLTPLVTVVECVILSDPRFLPAGDWRPPRRREASKKASRGWLWVLKRGPHHSEQATSGALRQAPGRPPQRLSLHPPGHRLRKHNCAGLFQTHYLSSAPAS